MTGIVKDGISLMKPSVSALSAAAALLGCGACRSASTAPAVLAGVSVFLLSAGACALNNYQDRYFDRLMERTRRRPLPSGRFPPRRALILAVLLICAGLCGLYFGGLSPFAAPAGLLAVLLYNGVYTPLKKRTLLALIPGVLCGTLPPLVGWLSAGGGAGAGVIAYLMALFATWQLPHIWLLVLANSRDELRGDTPTFLNVLGAPRIRRSVIAWAAAFSFLTLFLKAFALIESGWMVLLLTANAFILPLVFLLALRGPEDTAVLRRLSVYLNVSVLGITLMGAADNLFR